ncbi:acetyl-CoA carboxylase biotin carboxylase subunit family protein [Deferrisoma palaeochoriense]
MRPAELFDSTLRDAVGNFLTLHVRSDELTDLLEALDRAGYTAIDAWGGASFYPTMEVLGEDPWERLRAVRRAVRNTQIQASVRSRFLFGTRPAPWSTEKAVLQRIRDLGVDRLRVLDMATRRSDTVRVVELAKETGIHVTVAHLLDWSDLGDAPEALVRAAQAYLFAGADAVSVHDPFGMLSPPVAERIVSTYRAHFSAPLRVHTHDVNLVGVAAAEAALRAGATGADVTISAAAWAYSPPQTESLLMALRGTPLDPGLDLGALEEAAALFEGLKTQKGFRYRAVYGVDHGGLSGQLPGVVRQAMLEEIRGRSPRPDMDRALARFRPVWEAFGRPPLLRPFLQAVCGQAVEDVVSGRPFATLAPPAVRYLAGEFGPPMPGCRADLVARAREALPEPARLPELDDLPAEAFGSEDDRLTYALFPKAASAFFERRAAGVSPRGRPAPYRLDRPAEPAQPSVPRQIWITRAGETHPVALEGMGPWEGNRRPLFLRVGPHRARVDVEFPPPGRTRYVIHLHGKAFPVEIAEVLPPGARSLPVVLREGEHTTEVLYSFSDPTR